MIQVDQTGGSPDMVTTYEYINQGFGDADPITGGAWRKADPDGMTKDEDRTWSVWRGYPKVVVRTGSMQTLTGRTDHYFFRGMDGDAKPGGGTRTVKVTDDTGAQYADSDELAGTELETVTYNGAEIVSRKISQPDLWFTHTQTETWGTRRASMVKLKSERVLTPLTPADQDAPVWRETKTNMSYDRSLGRILTTEDLGDVSTPDDDQCMTTEYADNPTAYMYKYPKLNEAFSVRCGAITDRATQLVSSERLSFDSRAYGAAPTKGDVTRRETLDGDDGVTTSYLQTTIEVNGYGRPTALTDPGGNTTRTSYEYTNGLNTRTTVTNPLGHTTVTDTSPAYGQSVKVVDANQKPTELEYDGLGRLTAVWLPDRPRAQGFSPNSRYGYLVRSDKPTVITTQKVKNDGSYALTYQILDSLLRVRQTQSEGPGGTWLLNDVTYQPNGKVDTATSPYATVGTAGEAILVVPDGTVNGAKQYRYDGADRITDEIFTVAGDERWRTRTIYDGAKTTTIPPAGGVARTTVVDARGHTTELREYAGQTLDGPQTITRYTYGPNGKITSLTDPIGKTWTYRYDQRGNLVQTTDPDAGITTFTYDALNRTTSEEDARHVVTSSVYDKLGRVVERWAGEPTTGTKLATWTYDTYYKGQLAGSARLVNGAAYYTTVPQRDSRYRPLKTSYVVPKDAGAELAGVYDFTTSYNPDGTIQGRGYPQAGQLPAENVLTTYDGLQRPIALTGLTTYVVNDDNNKTRYTDLGQLLQLTLWNSTGKKAWQTFEYERGTGRLTRSRLDRQDAPAVDMDAHYTYDDGGNVLSIADTPQGGQVDTQCFTYDGFRRMTEAWSTGNPDPKQCANGPATTKVGGPALYHQAWTFDDVGDRTSETSYDANGVATERRYQYPEAGANQPHTLTSVTRDGSAETSYAYDATGALVSRQTPTRSETFTWNAEGQMATSATAGSSTTYIYDVDGNRLVQKTPTATILYLGGMELRLDTTTRAVTGTRYYTFGDRVVTVRTPGRVAYVISDHHGTGTCSIDAGTGAIAWRRTTPYGTPRGATPGWWPDDKGFVGGTQDANGLVHLGAREYDPTIGRFISVDPVLNNDTPQQLNGYAYSANNPVTLSDPQGTDSIGAALGRAVAAVLQVVKGFRLVLPSAPPETCSSATPEYCHRSGSNRDGPIELFANWAQAEREGCPAYMDICQTTEYFRDGDPFTEEVKRLVTIDAARQQIEIAISQGQLENVADFHMSKMTPEQRKMAAINNAIGIATMGEKGMQYALSFLGSYDLKWSVVGADANGNPVVEYNLTNASTKASASPSKDKVQVYSKGGRAGDCSDAVSGEQCFRQSIRWRETYVDGKAKLANDTRAVYGPGFSTSHRNVRYNYPSQKDPLVSNTEYELIERALKGGLK